MHGSTCADAWKNGRKDGSLLPYRQPRQRTGPAARDSFNKSSLSSDVVGLASSQASCPTLASSSQDEVHHCYTEPTLRAVEFLSLAGGANGSIRPGYGLWTVRTRRRPTRRTWIWSHVFFHVAYRSPRRSCTFRAISRRHAAFKRGAEVGDLQQRLRDFTAELWRQVHEEKLWRHRGAGMNTEESMEVDGLEVDAMFLEDLMSRLPVLRARLISASPPEQLDALRELRQSRHQASSETFPSVS
eukprot:symbB.v1.2.023906.t1/scaffold2210.1/size85741/2